MNTTGFNYNWISPIYDWLAHAYSGGAIHRSKSSQLDEMKPGDKVLYAGVGGGAEAVLAARHEVELTCVDLSESMINRVRTRLDRESLAAELICGNVMDHDRFETYDVVAANYFFNCFSPEELPRVLNHVVSLIKPGGKLLIADYSIPNGNVANRIIKQVHYWPALVLFWSLGLAAWHPIYDYSSRFKELGCQLVQTQSYRIFGIGPACYQSITAKRQSESADVHEPTLTS